MATALSVAIDELMEDDHIYTEAAPSVGARYGVQAIPTMIFFRNGREVARQSGALQMAGILRFAEGHLGKQVA